jgi:hypothetical protein
VIEEEIEIQEDCALECFAFVQRILRDVGLARTVS